MQFTNNPQSMRHMKPFATKKSPSYYADKYDFLNDPPDRGYSSQDRGYSSPYRDYSSQDRGYSQQDRDFSPRDRSYFPPDRGYSPSDRDYSSQNRDYSSQNRDYSSQNRDYSSQNRDYSSQNRDYSPPDQDFSPPDKTHHKNRKWMFDFCQSQNHRKEADCNCDDCNSISEVSSIPESSNFVEENTPVSADDNFRGVPTKQNGSDRGSTCSKRSRVSWQENPRVSSGNKSNRNRFDRHTTKRRDDGSYDSKRRDDGRYDRKRRDDGNYDSVPRSRAAVDRGNDSPVRFKRNGSSDGLVENFTILQASDTEGDSYKSRNSSYCSNRGKDNDIVFKRDESVMNFKKIGSVSLVSNDSSIVFKRNGSENDVEIMPKRNGSVDGSEHRASRTCSKRSRRSSRGSGDVGDGKSSETSCENTAGTNWLSRSLNKITSLFSISKLFNRNKKSVCESKEYNWRTSCTETSLCSRYNYNKPQSSCGVMKRLKCFVSGIRDRIFPSPCRRQSTCSDYTNTFRCRSSCPMDCRSSCPLDCGPRCPLDCRRSVCCGYRSTCPRVCDEQNISARHSPVTVLVIAIAFIVFMYSQVTVDDCFNLISQYQQ